MYFKRVTEMLSVVATQREASAHEIRGETGGSSKNTIEQALWSLAAREKLEPHHKKIVFDFLYQQVRAMQIQFLVS